jgi:hypothetical protein
LTHSIAELEENGFAILLPFYVIKLRKQVEKAKNSAELKKLSKPAKDLLNDLLEAVDSLEKKRKIDGTDALDLTKGLECLYKELFDQYDELAEGDIMLQDKLDFYGDDREKRAKLENSKEIAQNLLADGISPEQVAKCTKLPLKTVKAMQNPELQKPKKKRKVA